MEAIRILFFFVFLLAICVLPTFACDCSNSDQDWWCTNGTYPIPSSLDRLPFIAYGEGYNQQRGNKLKHFAGIIIDKNMILTRALFCEVMDPTTMSFRVGINYVTPVGPVTIYKVKETATHEDRIQKKWKPSFDSATYWDTHSLDFCLVRLTSDMPLSPLVQKAPLADHNHVISENRKLILGWGPFEHRDFIQYAAPDGDTRKAGLHFQLLRYITADVCWDSLKRLGIKAVWADDIMCAGRPCHKKHPGYGDEGAPLFEEESQTVIAITSPVVDKDCCNQYTYFNKISYARKWIEKMRKKWNSDGDDDGKGEDELRKAT